MFVCLLGVLILGFCYRDLTLETRGFELASITTLVLQANQQTKCASHPKIAGSKMSIISFFLSIMLMYLNLISFCGNPPSHMLN